MSARGVAPALTWPYLTPAHPIPLGPPFQAKLAEEALSQEALRREKEALEKEFAEARGGQSRLLTLGLHQGVV